MYDNLAKALDYHSAGLCPLALPYGSKRSRNRWGDLQNRQATLDEIRAMFGSTPHNVALVAGRASDNLIVLDCDNKQAYDDFHYRLAEMGIRTWNVQRDPNGSPHDGGGHIYLRSPVAVKSRRLAAGVEVKAQRSYVLAPLSLHPEGTLYRTAHGDHRQIFALPRLDAVPGLTLYEAEPIIPKSRLAKRLLRGLVEVGPGKRYATRSEADAALILSLINTGHTQAHIQTLFNKYPTSGKYHELMVDKPGLAEHYLTTTWENALEYARNNQSEARNLALALVEWVDERPWPGRTGATDRAVYLAHLEIVKRCGKNPYAASCRDLAEIAGVSAPTAGTATSRLLDQSLLKVHEEATIRFSTRYRLLEPTGSDLPLTLPHKGYMRECKGKITAGLDCFRFYCGLGKTSAQLYTILAQRGRLSEAELREVTGRSRGTVRRRLCDMAELGLVSQWLDGSWGLDDLGDLEMAAWALGTAGRADQQRRKHSQQRELRRRVLDALCGEASDE